MVLARRIGPGVPYFMAVAAHGYNTLDSGDSWVLGGFVDRGGRY